MSAKQRNMAQASLKADRKRRRKERLVKAGILAYKAAKNRKDAMNKLLSFGIISETLCVIMITAVLIGGLLIMASKFQ